ncbi:protease, partial [Rhodoplanes roseus]
MAELLFLLVGGRVVREKWWIVGLVGSVWLLGGVFFFTDALIEEIRIHPAWFAVPLLLDAIVSLTAALGVVGGRRALRFVKAAVLILVSVLILDHPWRSDMIVGFLVGFLLVIDASWRAASAVLVRYPRWRRSVAAAALEFVIGLWSFVPWPTNWEGEVGVDVGTLMIVTALGLLTLALRIRRLPAGVPVARLVNEGWPADDGSAEAVAAPDRRAGTVTVHVWTPTGAMVSLRRGIARYVAALDENGVISTGHAALEAGPAIYISHYPAVEIERDQAQFTKTLRATAENDVPGRFQPSYTVESAEWCPSTRRVELHGLDLAALEAFWSLYRRDSTYNLTNRNCSSAVAKALDAAVEGVFAERSRSLGFMLRLALLPELWAAGVMRRRAALMAWTPGLVLDYARALAGVLELPAR